MLWKRGYMNRSYACVLLGIIIIVCVTVLYGSNFRPFTSCNRSNVVANGVKDTKVHASQCGVRPVIKQKEEGFENVDYIQEMRKLNNDRVSADDARLIELIRRYYLIPPSALPYNMTNTVPDGTPTYQASIVDSKLHYKRCGFFVESGAYDGELLSNTLWLEQNRNWNGILIEPNPVQFIKLQHKHRKVYAINACISTENYPSEKWIINDDLTSKVQDNHTRFIDAHKSKFKVQCFPLYSILLALNRTDIDYLSLDIEGGEQGLLDSLPWHKVNINMMSIEYTQYTGGAQKLCRDMERRGYHCLVTLTGKYVADVILRKKSRSRKRNRQ